MNKLLTILPGQSTRADQIFVHVKFFERFRNYILYIIYNLKLREISFIFLDLSG